jgi:hypothetical protein
MVTTVALATLGESPAQTSARAHSPDAASVRPAGREPLPAAARTGSLPLRAGTARPTAAERRLAERRKLEEGIEWRRSRALGTPNAGRLVDGVKLPHEGVHFFTWDPVRWTSPNPAGRRWGTDRLLRGVLDVAREHRRANPGAPRVAVGDLSRPQGGSFDARHGVVGEFRPGNGTLGHVSHQNGLDVDIYYPRRDGREHGPRSLGQIDLELSQDLVNRFVAAGAQLVIVGPNTPLTGPPGVVQAAARHDDHIHVRFGPG